MESIVRIVLLLVAFFASTNCGFCQTFFNSPDDTIEITGFLEDLQTLTIEQHNISNDTITLSWQKVSDTVPALWEASVCDNVFCYTSLVAGGIMNPIASGDLGFLLMHITAHVNYGTAVIRYAVWDVLNPSLKDTLTYILHVTNASAFNTLDKPGEAIVYPVPFNDVLNFKFPSNKICELQVESSEGKLIYSSVAGEDFQLATDNWTSGIYFLKMKTQDGLFINKIIRQ